MMGCFWNHDLDQNHCVDFVSQNFSKFSSSRGCLFKKDCAGSFNETVFSKGERHIVESECLFH